jgi:hypothetical protein
VGQNLGLALLVGGVVLVVIRRWLYAALGQALAWSEAGRRPRSEDQRAVLELPGRIARFIFVAVAVVPGVGHGVGQAAFDLCGDADEAGDDWENVELEGRSDQDQGMDGLVDERTGVAICGGDFAAVLVPVLERPVGVVAGFVRTGELR